MDLAHQITSKFGAKGNKYTDPYDESQLIDTHHKLMKAYGWIPIDEFKKIPLSMLHGLNQRINEDLKREQEESNGLKKMFGGK